MDIRFDAAAAERLIEQMFRYCTELESTASDMIYLLQVCDDWNDNQRVAFEANIEEIRKDLNLALSLESDYMKTYYQRVKELRGE